MNHTDKSDSCPLVHAARNGHLDIVEYLVSCDWAVAGEKDLGLPEAAQQSFVAAASSGNIDIVQFLLDLAEVKIDKPDTLLGETALCAAAAAGRRECCEGLVRRGAEVS